MKTKPENNVWLIFNVFSGQLLEVEFERNKAEDAFENFSIIVEGFTCGRYD